MYKRNIIFRDAEGNKTNIDIEITKRNGYPELTMSGDYSGSLGQIVNHIKPKNEYQKELINIWNKYHLNGMQSGTKKQMNIINSYIQGEIKVSKDVEDYIQYKKNRSTLGLGEIILSCTNKKGEIQIFSRSLKLDGSSVSHSDIQNQYSKGLISEIDYVNSSDIFFDGNTLLHPYDPKKHTMLYDGDYKYGSSWIKEDLPENIIELLDTLCDNIEGEESNNLITIEDIDNEEFIEHANDNCEGEVDKLMAACIHCGVSWSGLENVTCNGDGTYWDVEGCNYYIYTDEEADTACKDNIKETAWAFNSDFIISHSKALDYDKGSYDILKAIQEQCENGNDAILRLIDDEDEFIEDAISSDGRGHFLSGYDGHENEVNVNGTTYYLYRNN